MIIMIARDDKISRLEAICFQPAYGLIARRAINTAQ
jgi:hypothetical protein